MNTHRFCIAPMMDWTDRHDRYFLRLLSKRSRLYSEMVTADAVRHGDRERLLSFNSEEHPVALQLGGSEAKALAEAAKIGEDFGYDEINLNVGCPSDRVQAGRFGACLMQEPELVAECVAAMRANVNIPVTVKSRIGVDDQDPEEALFHLVELSAQAGCDVFIVHARKAWLDGLSPKQNRDIPPLNYDLVYALKKSRQDLTIILNGGIDTLSEAETHLQHVDGVMLGRAAYKTPYILADVDRLIFNDDTEPPCREAVVEALIPYAEKLVSEGVPLHALTRHLMGLFQSQPGGRLWRRYLSENAPKNEADASVLSGALNAVRQAALQAVQRKNDINNEVNHDFNQTVD